MLHSESQIRTELTVKLQGFSSLHLISGTLHSTPLQWLPVLSNTELPALRRKAASDKLV